MNHVKRIIHSRLGTTHVFCTFALVLVTAMVAVGFQEPSRAELLTQVPAVLNYTPIDYPGALDTYVQGINKQGKILGTFTKMNGGETDFHGFLMENGVFSSLPDAKGYINNTTAQGINNLGQITIATSDGSGNLHGFLLENGAFTSIDYKDSSGTSAMSSGPHAINDSGDIVGTVDDLASGYLRRAADGTFSPIRCTNGQATDAYGINNFGEYAGYFVDENGYHGFITGTLEGDCNPIDFPNAPNTIVYGINNNGDIVGAFGNDPNMSPIHGFIKRNNAFTQVDIPDAQKTFVISIRDDGKLVGYFQDGNDRFHGFVGTSTP